MPTFPTEPERMEGGKMKPLDARISLNLFVNESKADLVKEYIEEAEHQDGEAYWSQFETVAELLEDFALYVANRD